MSKHLLRKLIVPSVIGEIPAVPSISWAGVAANHPRCTRDCCCCHLEARATETPLGPRNGFGRGYFPEGARILGRRETQSDKRAAHSATGVASLAIGFVGLKGKEAFDPRPQRRRFYPSHGGGDNRDDVSDANEKHLGYFDPCWVVRHRNRPPALSEAAPVPDIVGHGAEDGNNIQVVVYFHDRMVVVPRKGLQGGVGIGVGHTLRHGRVVEASHTCEDLDDPGWKGDRHRAAVNPLVRFCSSNHLRLRLF